MTKVIAVDLGGTHMRVSLVQNNKIIIYNKESTPRNKNELVNQLFKMIKELMDKNKDVKGIGVASPGPLADGIIKNPPNLPLKNYNLKRELVKRFRVKVEIENDADCVAVAESKLGCKKEDFFILTLGTGIGGGVIVNGEHYRGNKMGGELGQIIIDNGKTMEQLWQSKKKSIKELFESEDKKEVERISRYLGQGIASLINVLDPEVIVLAGGVRETGNKFLDMIKKQTKKYVSLPKTTPIQWTKLEHPGTLGASLLMK